MLSGARKWPDLAPYERRGILFSEILFLAACLEGENFERIIESGTARGQSAFLLSTIFADKEVISVVYDHTTADAAFARTRLAGRANVKLVNGDSRKIIPAILKRRDVVLIDGPKSWRAIALAARLLSTGKLSFVFIHDLKAGDRDRKFVDRYLPESRFSDARVLAEISSGLDESAGNLIASTQRLDGFSGDFGYGYSLGCIPFQADRNYGAIWLLAKLYALAEKLTKRSKA
jgi:hypothetical protein